MNPSYRLLALALVALVGVGCGRSASTPTQIQAPIDPHAGHQMPMGQMLTDPQASRIAFENATRTWSKPGSTAFIFRILGTNGADLGESDLKIVHEKRVHFLLVRDDMTQFQHLHPTYEMVDGNKRWVTQTLIPEPGNYHVYVDIAPEKEEPIVLQAPVRIGKATMTKTFPSPTAGNAVTTDDIQTTLTTPSPLVTGSEVRLAFALMQNGQPVKNIDPYLGTFGHVVILRHNAPEDFLHVHPVTQTTPTDGMVEFATTFKTEGRYTLYAQFNVNGSIKTFPITVDVSKGNNVPSSGMMDHSQH